MKWFAKNHCEYDEFFISKVFQFDLVNGRFFELNCNERDIQRLRDVFISYSNIGWLELGCWLDNVLNLSWLKFVCYRFFFLIDHCDIVTIFWCWKNAIKMNFSLFCSTKKRRINSIIISFPLIIASCFLSWLDAIHTVLCAVIESCNGFQARQKKQIIFRLE